MIILSPLLLPMPNGHVLKSIPQFMLTLKDKTKKQWGAMDMLTSDRVSKHVKDAIRSFVITKDWQWIDNKVKKYHSRNLNCWSGVPLESCLIVIRYPSLIMYCTA